MAQGAATNRRCEWCADPFEPRRGHQIFCTNKCCRRACMRRFHSGQNVWRDLVCAECGTVFSVVRRDARFCTRRCSDAWHNTHRLPALRAKRRNRLAAEPRPGGSAATPASALIQQPSGQGT